MANNAAVQWPCAPEDRDVLDCWYVLPGECAPGGWPEALSFNQHLFYVTIETSPHDGIDYYVLVARQSPA